MRSAWLVMAAVAAGLMLFGSTQAEDKKADAPKITIKVVMKEAMKDGLCKKCGSGQATAEEKKRLVELFTALGENKPPKGDADAWKMKTEALIKAAKAIEAGEKEGAAALGKAANCGACHGAHKPA